MHRSNRRPGPTFRNAGSPGKERGAWMGLGEMRRGRVDTLYSEQESIRFVVKKSRFVPFLQWVAISLSASAGSPGRSGELRSSTDCAACQLTPSRTRLPRSPGRPGFHKFPDRKSAGPVFAGSFHPEISLPEATHPGGADPTRVLPANSLFAITRAEPREQFRRIPAPASGPTPCVLTHTVPSRALASPSSMPVSRPNRPSCGRPPGIF